MSVGNELDINTLSWVKSEIDDTLNQARHALEAYVEDNNDESRLQFCLNYLHQVSGTLQMVELYGAAMASEEMEKLVQALIDEQVTNRNDAYEVLMRGVLQLPDYLEHLLGGHKDLPVVLLPLLNDLRAARGESLLSENALFSPDLTVTAPATELVTADISDVARKLRHSYHLGLLGWFKDKESEASLERIRDVIDKLRNVASEQEINRLLWVAGGLVESLRLGGIDSSVSTKLLLGQLDRQIKKIIDNGLTALSDEPPHELLKNLLYYIATSASDDARTQELKQAFRLDEVLPDTRNLEQARADLAGPNAALMGTVSSVLLDDLSRVKDTLDVFVRKEERDVAELESLFGTLNQMADTLGMMGLGVQRKLIHNQVEVLSNIVDGKTELEENALMDVAGAMLSLESSLKEASIARAANEQAEKNGGEDVTAQEKLKAAEQHQLLGTVIEQASGELIHVKEALNEYSRYPSSPDVLQIIPDALTRIRGSLAMLDLGKAAELLDLCSHFIKNQLLTKRITPEPSALDDLADTISSIEYYLESLVGKWGHPETILSVAENSITRLLSSVDAAGHDEDEHEATLTELEMPSEFAESGKNDQTLVDISDVGEKPFDEDDTDQNIPQPDEFNDDLDFNIEADVGQGDITNNDITMNDISLADLDTPKPELNLELADDGLEQTDNIVKFESTSDTSQQITLNDISLNEIPGVSDDQVKSIADDETIPAIEMDFSDVSRLQEVDAGEIGQANDENTADFDFAVNLDEQQLIEEPVTEPDDSSVNIVSTTSSSVIEMPEDIDEEILEIFLEEAEEEYQNISKLLLQWQNNLEDKESLKEMRRSFHTLKGSGRLVGALDVGEFAWAFENMLNRVIDNTVQPGPVMIDLMYRCKDTLPQLFELFKQRIPADQSILKLIGFAEALSQGKEVTLPGDEQNLSGQIVEPEPEPEPEVAEEVSVAESSVDFVDLSLEEESVEVSIPHVVDDELAATPLQDVDPVLLDIYRKEVATHLETLRHYNTGWQTGKERGATDALLRALHTLTGSSRTTGVTGISELCGSFEKYIKELQAQNKPVDEYAIRLLRDTSQYVIETSEILDKPGAVIADNSDLLEKIESLSSALQSGVEIEAPVVETVNEPEPSVLTSSPEPVEAREYDDELLEIFIEEGEEILEESDHTLTQWMDAPEDNELLEVMQRQLHTLKGGARMAGVVEIGDLGHSVESLLTGLVDGQLSVSKRMFTVLQQAQDRLVHLLEQVKFREGLQSPQDLIEQLEALSKPGSGEPEETTASLTGSEAQIETIDLLAPTESAEIIAEVPLADSEPNIELEDVFDTPADLTIDETVPTDESLDFQLDTFEVETDEDLAANIADPEQVIPEPEPLSEPSIEVGEITVEETASSEPLFEEPVLDEPLVEEPVVEEIQPASDNIVELPQRTDSALTTAEPEPPVSEPSAREPVARTTTGQPGQLRVRADLLDNLVNFAGEVSIYRSRMEQQSNSFRFNLKELDDTVSRLRQQLREFEIETEAQIQYRKEESLGQDYEDFDPLEFDRFTHMQQLSRGMLESLNDLDSLRTILSNITRESETLLLQQARVNTELQEGLMSTRMVPFAGQSPRLRRIVRQTSDELKKSIDFQLVGMEGELDRTVLDRIMPAIEHMLRNAISHGIETPQQRKQVGKPETGKVELEFKREGSDIVIRVSDDGAGFNLEAIKNKAIEKGMLKPGTEVPRDTLLNLVLESGFSTAESVTQISGRGVGMDVVNNEIRQLGGLLNIDTEEGKGTTFTINMPLSLAIARALMVHVGEDTYAIPLMGVQAVERISTEELRDLQAAENPVYHWLDEDYQFLHLGSIMGTNNPSTPVEGQKIPLLLVRSGEHRAAIHVESLIGSREVVVKPVGPQLSTLRGISGATIMGDGQIVLILDLGVLIRLVDTAISDEMVMISEAASKAQLAPTVMVVDDSITVRKVTTRLLERNKFQVVTAKDGVDALSQLQEIKPDVILLDVEMPRMDGYELAINVRNDERLKDIPIIMITSRTADKHRQRAIDIGVNFYMGKPFNETELLENIEKFVSN